MKHLIFYNLIPLFYPNFFVKVIPCSYISMPMGILPLKQNSLLQLCFLFSDVKNSLFD